jgi:hypothetical protein
MRAMYIGFREAPDQKAVATPNSTQAGVKVKKFGRIGPIRALLIEKCSIELIRHYLFAAGVYEE